MKHASAILTLVALLVHAGCDDSNHKATPGGGGGRDGGLADARPAGDGGLPDGGLAFPPAPALGAQIDRMGRPAINTALTDPFWDDGTRTLDSHEKVQDAYNTVSDPALFVTTFKAQFAKILAIYDALDGVCGNQLLYNGRLAGGGAPAAGAYDTFAGVLADDRLTINTAAGTCTTYLGVEADATGLARNSDCGGRTPTENVIDETYALLAAGQTSVPGLTNGITSDPDGHASDVVFPFLGPPNGVAGPDGGTPPPDGGTPPDAATPPPDAAARTCPGGGAPVATIAVTVADFHFTPPCITVAAGATVTWTNTGMPIHTVTSDAGAPVTFNSGALGTGGTFSFTFPTPGVVGYHCIPHQSIGMVGTVIVQ
ncbi:MAG TPA: plastocyanin/azurin family copper-binding protein [Polyangia bacterium]|jgi:plastocyanin